MDCNERNYSTVVVICVNKQVVVFDNKSDSVNDYSVTELDSSDENETGAPFLIRILRYLETPQYLRKALFPKHNSLRYVVLKCRFFFWLIN